MTVSIRPLTPETWPDLERLFGEKGACGGCWCMWWRLTHSEFELQKGDGNHRALERLVGDGVVPGLLAYAGSQPVGWCAVGPRGGFRRLQRSRILAPVDDQPVWSVVCFFVARSHRDRGVSRQLLAGAKRWLEEQGGGILEGYPVEPKTDRSPPLFAFTGVARAFEREGFTECARRSPTRPIMRCRV